MLKQEWRYFLMALGFFTRIPVANLQNFNVSELNYSAKYFPLIGWLVGAFGALIFYLVSLLLPHSIAVLVSMASTIYLTGAFHEDGLADSADGLGGGWQREQVLTIMQDSRLGTYGAVALFFMLFSKYQVLNQLHPMAVVLSLLVAHALSRFCAVGVMRHLHYVKSEGKSKPLATMISMRHFWVAMTFGVLPYFVLLLALWMSGHGMNAIIGFMLATLIPILLAWIWWCRILRHRLGGYTGDTLGAIQQITELVFYLGVLVWSVHL